MTVFFPLNFMFSESLDNVQIIVGTNQWKSGTQYGAEKFIIHEGYDKPRFAYDIGLIRMQTPIEFNDRVQPIKFSVEEVPAGTSLQVTGWGLLNSSGSIPDNLQVLNVTSIANEECKRKAIAHDSHLCTLGPRGKGICGVSI